MLAPPREICVFLFKKKRQLAMSASRSDKLEVISASFWRLNPTMTCRWSQTRWISNWSDDLILKIWRILRVTWGFIPLSIYMMIMIIIHYYYDYYLLLLLWWLLLLFIVIYYYYYLLLLLSLLLVVLHTGIIIIFIIYHIFVYIIINYIWGFSKWWIPKTMGFNTKIHPKKMDDFGDPKPVGSTSM